MQTREKIINDFAEWAAFSSTRSGCPVKSRTDIYPLIRLPDYKTILDDESISEKSFDQWHRENTIMIHDKDRRLPIGWAAKLINVYLKTRVYIAGEGHPNLRQYIHPPIDQILWKAITDKYCNDPVIGKELSIFTAIKDIKKYDQYREIILLCKEIAKKRKLFLCNRS